MKITLYKNCILSARNTEVFRTQALLETYLNTLQKPYSGSDIQISNTYAMIRGTLQLDISNFNGDFNYIKFEDINNKKWYAFVDSFSYVDTLLIINYTQDIWHTYLGQWSLRESLVIRSYRVISGEPYEMPLNYINNGEITVAKLKSDNDTDNSKYAIIVKLQIFDLVSGGSIQGVLWEGYTAYSFVNYSTTPTSFSPINSLNSVADVLDSMQEKQNEKKWRLPASVNDFYARIVETYVVPANWLENSSIFASNINNSIRYVNDNVTTFYNMLSTSDLNIKRLLRTFELYDTMTREDTKLMLSFGTYTSQIPYSFDGINKKIKLYLSSSRDELSFYIDYDGHTIDITQQFIVLQDYTATTPDVLAQREIARKVQTVKGITGIVDSVANIAGGITNIIGGAKGGGGYGGNASFEQEMGWNLPSSSGANIGQIVGGSISVVKGTTSLIKNVANIAAANAKKYMTFTTSNNDTKAYINAYFGLCYMYAENTVNDYEVVKAITEVGYSVNYFTNDLDLGLSIYTNNMIQFGFVRLVGLSTEICEYIANILTSGVKIWYTANV